MRREPWKNQYIDALKGMACIIVVFLHCPLPGLLGDGIIYGLRFSVPVFFLISGYYSSFKNDAWVVAKAKYILKLLLLTELFYGIWTVISKCMLQRNTLEEVYEAAIGSKNIFQIIFCGTLFNGTLWYLYAMFWTWMMIYLLRRTGKMNKCYILIPVLLAVQIFGRAYVQNVYDIEKYVFLFRNAVTFGIPFSLLGAWIAQKEAVIAAKIDLKKNLMIILGGFFLIIIEFLLFGQYMDTHVSTVLIAAGMFFYAVRQQGEGKKSLKGLAYIGARWSAWIYLLHMFLAELIRSIYKGLPIEEQPALQYAFPFLVCILAGVCSELIVRSKKQCSRP